MSADTPDEPDRVIIRDNRKIDPVTGEARKPAGSGAHAAPEPGRTPEDDTVPPTEPTTAAPATADAVLLDERTRDLQRVQAEYANYRKRADRERLAAGELAVGRTLAELLPVIDDLDRAKAHGDLGGPLKAVADKLDAAFAKLGLQAFGEVGDPFDPSLHEAVLHDESEAVTEPTCTTIMRAGYKHHDRLLRPAMVGVSDPASPTPVAEPTLEGDDPAQADDAATPADPPNDEVPAQGEPEPTEPQAE
jgi:molecular chaperone GrpE